MKSSTSKSLPKSKGKTGAKVAQKPSGTKTSATPSVSKPPAPAAEPPKPQGVTCTLRQVNDVLLKDRTGKIKESGKWPLLVDTEGKSVTFLQYQDSNYLCTANSKNMEPDAIRRGLIGSIRFGKPFLIDMLDTDMYDILKKSFNDVQPNLLQDLMTKKVLEEDEYLKLVKPEDGELYERQNFNRVDDFIFIIATKKNPPPDDLTSQMFPVKVEG